jgi:hypothetical protein
VARVPRGRGRRRVHLASVVALSAIAFTLSVAAPGAIAQEPPPTPSPTPEPSPEPSADPSPEPSPSPDPTSSPPPTSSPDPAPTSPSRNPPPPADDPTTSEGGPGHTPLSTDGVPLSPFEAALSLLGGSTDQEDAGSPPVGTGSLFETVGSIIDELTSSDDRVIRAAEVPSTCAGVACGSPNDVTRTRTLFIVLICLAVAIAGAFAIRATSRRSTTALPSDQS